MGKGDKKSKRGKIAIGSYGVRRPRKKSTPRYVPTKSAKIKETIVKVVAEPIAEKVTMVETTLAAVVTKKPKVSKPKVAETKAEPAKKPKAEKKPAAKPKAEKLTAKKEPAAKPKVKKAKK